MSNVAIQVDTLGKRYRIGARAQDHTMRDRLTHALTAPARNGLGCAAAKDLQEPIERTSGRFTMFHSK